VKFACQFLDFECFRRNIKRQIDAGDVIRVVEANSPQGYGDISRLRTHGAFFEGLTFRLAARRSGLLVSKVTIAANELQLLYGQAARGGRW